MRKKQAEARKRRVLAEIKCGIYKNRKKNKILSAITYLLIVGSVLLAYIAYKNVAMSAVDEPVVYSSMPPAAGTGMFADYILIAAVPITALFVVYQLFVPKHTKGKGKLFRLKVRLSK